MNAQQVLSALRAKAKPGTAAIYRRHGAQGEVLGVSYADMNALVKRLPADQELARALWRSGVHEAWVVAPQLADPARTTRAELARWLKQAGDPIAVTALAGLAARAAAGAELALEWIDSRQELPATCGWNVLGILAGEGRLGEAAAARLLQRIERELQASPDRTRYAMNNTLIAIGGYMAPLRAQALQVARAVGKVQVDHGQTGCKTPDAASYIAKMAARQAARQAAKPARQSAPKARQSAPKARQSAPKARQSAPKAGSRSAAKRGGRPTAPAATRPGSPTRRSRRAV